MAVGTKRKHADATTPPATPTKMQKTYAANTSVKRTPPTTHTTTTMQPQLDRIARSASTPFQKRVLSLLCQVPRGRVTTYGLMAEHLGSSARAVGGAMRRNPFAPQVPCHRVVAAGGALGGFKGEWTKDGEGLRLEEKRRLLAGEGIRFDGAGRVVGAMFDAFV